MADGSDNPMTGGSSIKLYSPTNIALQYTKEGYIIETAMMLYANSSFTYLKEYENLSDEMIANNCINKASVLTQKLIESGLEFSEDSTESSENSFGSAEEPLKTNLNYSANGLVAKCCQKLYDNYDFYNEDITDNETVAALCISRATTFVTKLGTNLGKNSIYLT